MKLDKYKEASNLLSQILKLNPDYYKAYAGIGLCFDKLGKKMDAIRYYRKFLSLKPFCEQATTIRNRLDKLKFETPQKEYLYVCK